LDAYDLAKSDIKSKYNTRACDFYRRRLSAIASNQPFSEEPPSKEEGVLPYNKGTVVLEKDA